MSDGDLEEEDMDDLGAFFSSAEEYCEFVVKDRLKNTLNKALYKKLPGALKLHIWDYINCHIPGQNYLSVMSDFKKRFKILEYTCRGHYLTNSCNNVYQQLIDNGCPKSPFHRRIWNENYGLIKINIHDKKYDHMFNNNYDSDNKDNENNKDEVVFMNSRDRELFTKPEYSYYCSEKCVEKTIHLQTERAKLHKIKPKFYLL
tara:strand:- start:10968 stop:11573 length:606 start_codon:yes stop_codon:yes gene_type:complete